ncbi:MAG: hypothetical protein WCJ72_07150 [Chryseobacterium sp.]
MKYIFCLLFLFQIKNCKSETPSPSKISSNEVVKVNKVLPDSYLINSVDKNAVGEKVEDQEKVKQLKNTLKSSFDRGAERPYMWDVFVSSNDDLLQFYQYKDFVINNNKFTSY